MKFITLVKHELRQNLAISMLVLLVVMLLGSLFFTSYEDTERTRNRFWDSCRDYPGTVWWNGQNLDNMEALYNPILCTVVLGAMFLAFVIVVKQFYLPTIQRTWSFLLHRSVSKYTILTAKLLSSLILLICSAGLGWTYFYFKGQSLIMPVPLHTFYIGIGAIGLAYLFYLALSIVAISHYRWCGMRLLPLLVVGLIVVLNLRISYVIMAYSLLIGFFVLIIDLFVQFRLREFK